MKKKLFLSFMQLMLCCVMLHAQTTTISASTTSACGSGSIDLTIHFNSGNSTGYHRVDYQYEIFKNGTSYDISPIYSTNVYPSYTSMNFTRIYTLPSSAGSGSYTVKAKSWSYRYMSGVGWIAQAVAGPATSSPLALTFNVPPSVSFRINGVNDTYTAVCHNEDIKVSNFDFDCCVPNPLFLSIRETNGIWGPTIGTEQMEWVNMSNPNGLDIRAWAASKGITLTAGHNYTFVVAVSPWTPHAVAFYIKPTAPGLHVNGTQVTGVNYPADVKTVCASNLNTAFNAYSTTCESRYLIEVAECNAYLVRTGTHEWVQWFDNLPGIENVGVFPLADLTATYGGFTLTGGNLPGALGPRYWRVTIATGEPTWQTVTALVRVNDGCLVLAPENNEEAEINAGQLLTDENGNSLDAADVKLEDLLKNFVPVEGEYPEYILEIDKIQEGITIEHKVFPNPASENVSIDINVLKDSEVEVVLVDMNGQTVKTVLPNNYLTTNRYTYTADLSGLSKGVYMVRIKTGSEVITDKLIVQ